MNQQSIFEFREVACPVCDSEDVSFIGWRGGSAHHNNAGEKTRVVRCRSCTHQYPNPMPMPKVRLEDLYSETEDYFLGHEIKSKQEQCLGKLSEIERKLGRKGKYLDVGSGMGEFLWAADQRGWEYEGVDPSAEFVGFAEERLGVRSRVATLHEAAFDDATFDAVTMSSLIEHLYDPFELLREVWRVLKPGGILWLDAPNEDSLYSKCANLYLKLMRKDWVVVMAPTFPPYHVQGFNPESVRRILERSNFQLDEIFVWGGVWEFTGKKSIKKSFAFQVAKTLNGVGNRIGMGSYMSIWCKKPESSDSSNPGSN